MGRNRFVSFFSQDAVGTLGRGGVPYNPRVAAAEHARPYHSLTVMM